MTFPGSGFWNRGAARIGSLWVTTLYLGTTALSFTAAQFNQVMAAFGAVSFDRAPKIAIKALTGAGIHAAVVNWQNPEAVSIIITRVIVDVTTVSTGAGKLDIGSTATSATTASDNLIDGIDVNAATGLLGQADGDGVTNSKFQQKLAAGKWVTFKEISGDVTGLVANAYITYNLV